MDELPLLGRFCLPVFFLYMMCISIKSLTVYFPRELSSALFLFNLFIYLTLLGLSYGTLDLQSSLQHAGSLVVACRLLAVACGIQFLDQGLNLGPLHRENRVLATGPPSKFLNLSQCKFHCFLCNTLLPIWWERQQFYLPKVKTVQLNTCKIFSLTHKNALSYFSSM